MKTTIATTIFTLFVSLMILSGCNSNDNNPISGGNNNNNQEQLIYSHPEKDTIIYSLKPMGLLDLTGNIDSVRIEFDYYSFGITHYVIRPYDSLNNNLLYINNIQSGYYHINQTMKINYGKGTIQNYCYHLINNKLIVWNFKLYKRIQ